MEERREWNLNRACVLALTTVHAIGSHVCRSRILQLRRGRKNPGFNPARLTALELAVITNANGTCIPAAPAFYAFCELLEPELVAVLRTQEVMRLPLSRKLQHRLFDVLPDLNPLRNRILRRQSARLNGVVEQLCPCLGADLDKRCLARVRTDDAPVPERKIHRSWDLLLATAAVCPSAVPHLLEIVDLELLVLVVLRLDDEVPLGNLLLGDVHRIGLVELLDHLHSLYRRESPPAVQADEDEVVRVQDAFPYLYL